MFVNDNLWNYSYDYEISFHKFNVKLSLIALNQVAEYSGTKLVPNKYVKYSTNTQFNLITITSPFKATEHKYRHCYCNLI